MDVQKYYSNLPYDLAGSRSKNRFRVELLWGISKILDLMKGNDDFTVVFDYVCDVEILYDERLEFYQIKTHKNTVSPYTCKLLTKKDKPNKQGSILGKLYALNKENGDVKLAIVSNVSFRSSSKRKNKCIDFGEISLSSLENEDKKMLEDALKAELGIHDVDLSKVFYVYTPFNLLNPEDEVKGKIVGTFSEIKKSEPRNPNALYRLIFDTVEGKACYEYSENELKKIIQKKGVTRDEFNRMLDIHAENEKTGIKQAHDYIELQTNIKRRQKLNKALAELISRLPSSRSLQMIEKKVAKFLGESDCGTVDETVTKLQQIFSDEFPIEYNEEMRTLFFVIIIGRFEQGAY